MDRNFQIEKDIKRTKLTKKLRHKIKLIAIKCNIIPPQNLFCKGKWGNYLVFKQEI